MVIPPDMGQWGQCRGVPGRERHGLSQLVKLAAFVQEANGAFAE